MDFVRFATSLWLAADAPAQVEATPISTSTAGDGPDPDTEQDPAAQSEASKRRRRAKRADTGEERNPLLVAPKTESVTTWSEFVRLARGSDDEPDPNANAAADDMDTLTLARGKQTTASRVKFDLDLPSSSADDLPVAAGQSLPEWDYQRGVLRPDHCRVQTLLTRAQIPYVPSASLRKTARQLRRRLEVLRDAPRPQQAQTSGEDIDLDAWVRFQTEARGGVQHSDAPPIYTRRERGERSLATLLLADLSLSTDAYATSDARVIDVIRDALYVFGEALAATGDAFEMLGFSSVRRQHVRIQHIKGFGERWGEPVRARVGALKPGFYTRMGAAVRDATRGRFAAFGIDPSRIEPIEQAKGYAEHLGQYGLVDLALETLNLPDEPEETEVDTSVVKLAVAGRPNVGKSTLLNQLLEDERSIVSPIAGTTRDAIDAPITVDGQSYLLIDTAGIRRKKAEKEVVDKFAAIRTEEAIDRADVCLLVLDSYEGITTQEKRIASEIEAKGKSCILLFNKWDLVKNLRMEHAMRGVREEIPFLTHCPTLFLSAIKGRNLDQIFPAIRHVYAERYRKITTGQLNKFIEGCLQKYHPPLLLGKRLRIYYMTQIQTAPPKFIVFVNNTTLMVESYKKYLINQFRKTYQFSGCPIFFELRGKRGKPEITGKLPSQVTPHDPYLIDQVEVESAEEETSV